MDLTDYEITFGIDDMETSARRYDPDECTLFKVEIKIRAVNYQEAFQQAQVLMKKMTWFKIEIDYCADD